MSKQNDPSLPDKEFLYGKYQEVRDWRTRLAKKLAHKSLDIDDLDDVNVDQSIRGITWKEMGMIGLLVLGALALWQWNSNTLNQSQRDPYGVDDSEYEVRFYDAQGNPISVPHISQRQGP